MKPSAREPKLIDLGPVLIIAIARQSLAAANDVCVVPEVQAVFCRRRHQARRPPLAKIRPGKIRPGRPAPAMVSVGHRWLHTQV